MRFLPFICCLFLFSILVACDGAGPDNKSSLVSNKTNDRESQSSGSEDNSENSQPPVESLADPPLIAETRSNSEQNSQANVTGPAWDIDGDGQADALTDGLLLLRYLFGFRGQTLINGAVSSNATRSNAADIEAELARLQPLIGDIDGNGSADALTDGLLLLRYLFGFRGDTLTNGAISATANRADSQAIESFLARPEYTVNQTVNALSLFSYTIDSSLHVVSSSVNQNWLSASSNTFTGTPTFSLIGQTTTATIDLSNGERLLLKVAITEPTATTRAVIRLAEQATYGADIAFIDAVKAQGIHAWIDTQLNMGSAYDSDTDTWKTHLQRTIEIAEEAEPSTVWNSTDNIFNKITAATEVGRFQTAAWLENALGSPRYSQVGTDALRQRVAFALSQLLVVSDTAGSLGRRGEALAHYYDILARHAFGNFRTLLGEVARNPAMGVFLSHQGNRKTNPTTQTVPDENFARELMQLFVLGLYRLNVDGSPDRDNNPNSFPDSGTQLVPVYTQTDVLELSKVMTGWDLASNNRYGNFGSTQGNYTVPMEFTASEHEDEAAINGDGAVTVLGSTFALDSGADNSGLDAALDVLFSHSNVGPHIAKHLIQRLVTSNPSSGYIERVSRQFNDNGNGVRGDLKAVVRAILVDDEARDLSFSNNAGYGKIKEPLLLVLQFYKAIGVSPLNGWISRDGTAVNNVYWYRDPRTDISQGPLRSPSVFNFYSPSFVPSSAFFSTNNIVAPEAQLYTDQLLVNLFNRFFDNLNRFEKTRIETINGSTIAAFAATRSRGNASLFLFNFEDELALMEMAMEGDSNGDFVSIDDSTVDENGETARTRGINALINRLDMLLLGETMTDQFKQAMRHYLTSAAAVNSSDDFREAYNIVRDAFRFIAANGAFRVQK